MIFNLGIGEILIILVVAYLVLGPKGLPKVGKKAGEVVKRISDETKDIHSEIGEIKEAVIGDNVKSGEK
ncbi:twin-arginine translocase TatA/TatE family subunit [Wukongibacter baidiensis]|uniref:Sec-independent protein translocase subunit TatA/TatB n=1 Tax=Wukongibacter baidiensis TaxID=1723361 RepID=UPI003D7F4475